MNPNPFTAAIPVTIHDTSTNPPTTTKFSSVYQAKRFLKIAPTQQFSKLRSDTSGAVGWRYKHFVIVLDNPTEAHRSGAACQGSLFVSEASTGRPGFSCWSVPIGEEDEPSSRQYFPSVAKLADYVERSKQCVYSAVSNRLEPREALGGESAARVGKFWIGLGE